jgi:hypothetical protein
MMNRLRSTMQMLGAAAAFICALSLAAPSPSHAAPSTVSGTDDASQQPCNDVCKAYMAWSDRVSSKFHPSQPVAQTAVPDGKPAGQMVHRHASRMRQPSLNSFAQFPVRRNAAQSAETAQAVVAPSRPLEGIADRFPTTAGFVTALLAGTAGATNEAPDGTVVPVTDAIPATRGTSTIDATAGGVDMQFLVSLFLALCLLSVLVFWGWGRTQRAMR